MAKQVAKKESTQLDMFSDDKPEWVGDSGRGSEEVGIEDVVLPRIDIIQALSPQIKRNDPAYIEGAEQGMIFNTVTEKLYGNEVTFVPVYFRKEYLVWKKRTEGGGFRGSYLTEREAQEAVMSQDDASSLEIVDTAQHFVLIVDGDTTEQAVISMARSKMKVSRQLNSMARMAGGDRFSRAYKLKAVEDSSDKGDYWNFKVVQLGYVPEQLYREAEAMYEAVTSGQRSVDYSDVSDSGNSESDEF